MSYHRLLCALLALAMNVFAVSVLAATDAAITVTDSTVRAVNNQMSIGFNCPWFAIQGYEWPSGIWNPQQTVSNTLPPTPGDIRADIITFMKNSVPGVVYRYPGGTTSNTFRWQQTVGTSRSAQNADGYNTYPVFGFNEFMTFIENVKGVAMITVNVSAGADEAANWVAYANATTGTWADLRTAHGHPSPYNIKYWEIDNELDLGSPPLSTKNDYADACAAFITAMKGVDPSIKIIAHAASAPWGGPTDWYTWHQTVLDKVGSELAGIAFHPYYDGISIPNTMQFISQIWNDCGPYSTLRIYHTENARYQGNDQTTWAATTSNIGTVSTIDFMLASLYHQENAMTIYHAFAGTGPWRLFNGIGADGKQSNNIHCVRPLAHAFKLYARNVYGKEVLTTSTASSNYSNYGYDVRCVGLRDKDGTGLLAAAINRYITSPLSATVTMPGMTTGLYSGRLEYVGGDDEGASGILSRYVNTGSDAKFVFDLPRRSMATLRVLGGNYAVNPSFENNYYWPPTVSNTETFVTGNADSGTKYLQLAKTGSGFIYAVQGQDNNTALGETGFVGTHSTDRFIFAAMVRGNSLDSTGASLKIQFFQRIPPGTSSFVSSLYSADKVTGTTGWKPLSISFVPADIIGAGYTFNRMELCLQDGSTGGSAGFDTVALIHQPNLVLNGSFESYANSTPDNWTKSATGVSKRTTGARHGSNCVRLTGAGTNIAQYGWQNAALSATGILASRPADYFQLKAWAKGNGLTGSGAWLRIQIFKQPVGGGSSTFAGLADSDHTVSSDWTKLSISFRSQDYIPAGYEFSRADIVLWNASTATGSYVDFDSVGLYPDYDAKINDCTVGP